VSASGLGIASRTLPAAAAIESAVGACPISPSIPTTIGAGAAPPITRRALEHVPFSIPITAATPTTAYRDAGCACFTYAAPVPAGVTGMRIDVISSPGSSAVVKTSMKTSSAGIERPPDVLAVTIVAPSAVVTVG
jgi:hypothetical protein